MTQDNSQPDDFEILRPETHLYPVIFNAPHSGRHYRQDFIDSSRLTPLKLRKSEDAFVDQLFGQMPALGCPLLKANFPRAFLDVNRGPWELDPKMFSDKLPAHVETKTLRVMGGLGTIARNVSETEQIYKRKMSFTEGQKRIDRYYFPYHSALSQLINETRAAFGQCLLIDCHSMPSSATNFVKNRKQKPDIILGDRHGTSCDTDMIDTLAELFKAAGLNTTRNKPYAGGFITQTYGRPANGEHAIQIEINRGLYMDEKTISKNAGFKTLKQTLIEVFRFYLATVLQLPKVKSLAAE